MIDDPSVFVPVPSEMLPFSPDSELTEDDTEEEEELPPPPKIVPPKRGRRRRKRYERVIIHLGMGMKVGTHHHVHICTLQ